MPGFDTCIAPSLATMEAWKAKSSATAIYIGGQIVACTKGYVSGVYSSADAAVTDLQTNTTINGHPLDEPKAIWFALWDNMNNLTGAPYMNSSVWSVANRSKQYAGNETVKVGSYTLSIDADWVDSAVARG